jgi:hypothetical protein
MTDKEKPPAAATERGRAMKAGGTRLYPHYTKNQGGQP